MYKIAQLSLSAALIFVLTILWLSSYTHHTGAGIDHDFAREDKVLRVFSRISWTGYGSLWIGYGSTWKEHVPAEQAERFDVAAVFFRRVDKPLDNASFWNRAGFWYIHAKSPQPAFWVGIPSWLPVLVLGGLLCRRLRSK